MCPHQCMCASFLALIPGVGNFTVLRLLRAFRPLRTMGKLKGMRLVTANPFATTSAVIHLDAAC